MGQISESDVILASASNAIIIGFQVRPAQGARRVAKRKVWKFALYSIIYDALDDITTAMEGMLSPELREKVTANLGWKPSRYLVLAPLLVAMLEG